MFSVSESCYLQCAVRKVWFFFFSEKISEANRRFASLRAELDAFLEHAHKPHGLRRRKSNAVYSLFKDREHRETAQVHTRKLHDLKLAFSEFYLSLILLQNYQSLNFTGFRKILKKHDKVSGIKKFLFVVRIYVLSYFFLSSIQPTYF